MPYLPGMPEHEPNVEYNEFWEGCKRGELLIKKCKDCGWYIHYPRPLCPKCYSWNLEWSKVSGKGKVWTWTIVTEPIDPVVEGKVPYNVVEIELDEQEGLRLVSNLIDCEPEDITMGMPVEVVFDEMSPELTLPRFKKAS
jgi:uncharacterized OB-fold protein